MMARLFVVLALLLGSALPALAQRPLALIGGPGIVSAEPSFTAANLSNTTFAASTSNAPVGTVSAILSAGTASPTFAMVSSGEAHDGTPCNASSGADFVINASGGTLTTNSSGLSAGTYGNVCVSVTQSGVLNSPYVQAFSLLAETTGSYQGPCDVISGGCADAYSLDRAMAASYTGPLFQLVLASNHSSTLDVGQTANHTADMSTWSSFCGGVQSNCLVGKIYDNIHKGSGGDLVPAVFYVQGCNSGDAYTCAAAFAIDSNTGLPIAHVGYGVNGSTTPAPEYTVAGDATAAGFLNSAGPYSVFLQALNVNTSSACCGTFGWFHKYNAGDTAGTDFAEGPWYGIFTGPGGPYGCSTSTSFCYGTDTEGGGGVGGAFVSTSPINTIGVATWNPSNKLFTLTVNNHLIESDTDQAVVENVPGSIHLGGGGDLSQPAEIYFREGFVTATAMSASDISAATSNEEAFFSPLTFPNPP